MRKSPSLAAVLHKYLSVQEPERFSQGNTLHVTDLYNACFRQIYYSQKTGIPVKRRISPTLRLQFEMGNAVESVLRSWFADMGVVTQDKFVLINKDLNISGGPDGRLENSELIEIKAMAPPLFKLTKNKPLPQHEFQMATYLWLDGSKQGRIFSATWGAITMPFRDSIIYFNVKVAEIINRNISEFRESQVADKEPNRICKTDKEHRAIICPFREDCFSKPGITVKTIAEQLV